MTILFLVLLPPVGIVMVWRRHWPNAARIGLTAATLAVLALAVLLLPSGENRVAGGVELVGVEREVEVYGPALPTAMVAGYTSSLSTNPVFVQAEETDTQYVYAA